MLLERRVGGVETREIVLREERFRYDRRGGVDKGKEGFVLTVLHVTKVDVGTIDPLLIVVLCGGGKLRQRYWRPFWDGGCLGEVMIPTLFRRDPWMFPPVLANDQSPR